LLGSAGRSECLSSARHFRRSGIRASRCWRTNARLTLCDWRRSFASRVACLCGFCVGLWSVWPSPATLVCCSWYSVLSTGVEEDLPCVASTLGGWFHSRGTGICPVPARPLVESRRRQDDSIIP
jgi:hypothetical protein